MTEANRLRGEGCGLLSHSQASERGPAGRHGQERVYCDCFLTTPACLRFVDCVNLKRLGRAADGFVLRAQHSHDRRRDGSFY
jgi:hypothetical protein